MVDTAAVLCCRLATAGLVCRLDTNVLLCCRFGCGVVLTIPLTVCCGGEKVAGDLLDWTGLSNSLCGLAASFVMLLGTICLA